MIRRAEPADLEAVGEVFASSFETLLTFLPDLHTHEERRRYMMDVVARDQELWVAELDGRVVGLAALGEAELAQLYVHPDHIGRGIGSQLLEKTKELRPNGFALWTFPANERACRFYEKHGLRVVQHGDGSGNEEGLPDVQYEWRGAPSSDAVQLLGREHQAMQGRRERP
jgi:putative acetyltransferase